MVKKIFSALIFLVVLIAVAVGKDIGKHINNDTHRSSESSYQKTEGNIKMDVYEFARIEASKADAEFKRQQHNDGITVSAKAFADGKAIVYEYVLAMRRGLTESDLRPWRSGTRSEVVPQACLVIKQTPFFNQGFHFRYRYFDREGHLLDDFLVNRPACEGF